MTGITHNCSLLALSSLVIGVLPSTQAVWAQTAGPKRAARSFEVRDSQVAAAEALLKRLLPAHVDHFEFEMIPPVDQQDVFQLETRDGKMIIRGNTGVSMATGLNWYLKHYCHCHVSWYGNQLRIPEPLPECEPMVQQVSWARHRYFLNYCCFGYSLPFWDWEQWEQLIDWMALNGVNMPLSVTGQESVWQAVCQRLGMTDDEIREFLAGPPYLPFQWMGCLDGWGGPLPANWIDRHEQLQKKILARQREFGMTPVLQGFTGHIPPTISRQLPDVQLHNIRWIEWQTHLLDPLDPQFARISKMWMEEQTRRYGTDHYYAADTFIEMTPPRGELDYLKNLGSAIYRGMAQDDPEAIWVLQGWTFMFRRSFWTQPRIEAFLSSTPDDQMVILDLMCESRPMWSETEAFCGKPWLWCNIQDWGRRIFLGGALDKIAAELPAARRDANRGRISGLGFVNEGLGYNPIVYDLLYEMAWRDDIADLKRWIGEYAHHRYGQRSEHAQAAWQILADVVYGAPQGNRSVIDHVPSLGASGGAPYDNLRLVEAWHLLLQASPDLKDVDTFRFDLVNVARQALANHASILHRDVVKAHRVGDAAAFDAAKQRFLTLILDLDRLLATRQEFMLGCWLEDAQRWGDTAAEKEQMQWNARRVLTLWGEGPQIDDYACKQWSGMLSGYYHPRWKQYLDAVSVSLRTGQPFDDKTVNQIVRRWMADWSDQRDSYPTMPRGSSVVVAEELWDKYERSFVPDAFSLTTGKPVTCSHSLPPHPAQLANDGWAGNTDRYWATDVQQQPGPAWWQVDLEEPTTVSRVVLVAFYGDSRHYGFTVETSLDGETWHMVADRRENAELSTEIGYECRFEPHKVRYIRVTQTENSANSGRHLVEVMAYAFPGDSSLWHGFQRYDLEVDGKPVVVVIPKKATKGRPWVWHGEFFGHKPAPDIELLKRGFHVVTMRIPDMLGCPQAVQHWNALHKEMTTKYGLADKVALVGLSRGGLYCYNWASANPDKVCCIYGDAPVCDFKSWPGGKGKGKGDLRNWNLVMERYGFRNENEALAYAKNPIDNLQPLAEARVPLLHVYGDADRVVPWDENTGVIAERYRKLGGRITLIAKPGVGHHPHGLDDPTPIVDFIVENSTPD